MGWDDPVGRLSDPTPDEFRNWLRCVDLRRVFPEGRPAGPITRKLYYRLASGTMLVAAESAAWTDADGKRRRRGATSIDPVWWGRVGGQGVADAIEAGDVTINISDPEAGQVTVHFFNLRFEGSSAYDAIPELDDLLMAVRAERERRALDVLLKEGRRASASPTPSLLERGGDEMNLAEIRMAAAQVPTAPEPPAEPPRLSLAEIFERGLDPPLRGPPGAPPNQKRRGPKVKAFWAPLEAHIEDRISSGELRASRLVDIEEAMHDWLGEHGESAGEATVRRHATPIWRRLKARPQM